MLERFVSYNRPEIGTAYADVDDVANAFAAVAFPSSAAHAIGKIRHLIKDGVDLGHHVFAVNHDGCSFWRTQCNMQDSTVLRDVDLLAPKHCIDAFAQSGFFSKLQQGLESFVGNAIFRVI